MFNVVNGITHRAVAQRFLQARHGRPVADACAAVHVVGMEYRTGEFLHHIVGFITRPPGRAGGHDGPRAELRFNVFKLVGGITNGLVPGDRGKGFAFVVADHRLRQARGEQAGIVKEVPAVKAFQAQGALIGYAVCGFGTDNTVIFNNEV